MDRDARHAAVESAFRLHADDVYRVAYAISRRRDLAEDVTQETFARAFEHWDRFDPSRPLAPWLHTIAARIALDGLRRRRVRDFLGIDGSGGSPQVREIDVPDGRSGGGDPAADVLRRAATEEAMRGLAPRARAALVLRHYHGYDYASIAAILGTSPGNVGSLISRAHAQLRLDLATEAEPTAMTSRHPSDSREVLE